MHFREDPHYTESHKTRYISELDALISAREDELKNTRNALCADILKNGETHRRAYLDMLGWPLNAGLPRTTPEAEIVEELGDEGEYTLLRMKIQVMEGLWLNGLYFRLNTEDRRPLVIAQHGGAGTPELIAGFYYEGSDVNYNGMVSRLMPHLIIDYLQPIQVDADDAIGDVCTILIQFSDPLHHRMAVAGTGQGICVAENIQFVQEKLIT